MKLNSVHPAELSSIANAAGNLARDSSKRASLDGPGEPGQYTRATAPEKDQLRVQFSIGMVLVVLIAGMLLLGIIYGYLLRGIHLKYFTSSNTEDALTTASNYNFGLGSMVNLIKDLTMTHVVEKVFAVVETGFEGPDDWIEKGMTMLILPGLKFIIKIAATNAYVQLVPHGRQALISTEDLRFQRDESDFEWSESSWNKSCMESSPNNSALNTILHTMLARDQEVTTTCLLQVDSPIESPRVTFGYDSNNWMLDALPMAIKPKNSTEYFLADGAFDVNDLAFNLSIARSLYGAAVAQIHARLGGLWGSSPTTFYDFLNDARDDAVSTWATNSTLAGMIAVSVKDLVTFAGSDFLPASTQILQNLFADAPTVVDSEVKVAYQSFQLADTVEYTALTLTIPTRPLDPADEEHTIDIDQHCSPDGCLLPDEEAVFGANATAVKPFVHVAAMCTDKNQWEVIHDKSNCSLAIVSVGKRLSGTGFSMTTAGNPSIVVTDLRATYSLTVARLNWTLEDLAAVFDAKCTGNASDCYGVRGVMAALNLLNQTLLVGVSELRLGDLYDYETSLRSYIDTYDSSKEYWKPLVSVDKAPPILFPRNFEYVTDLATTLMDVDPSQCSQNVDRFVKTIGADRLYAEESLQMSYTAGFHYLFKTGVIHAIQHSEDGPSVEFKQYEETLEMLFSTPLGSAIVSFIGMAVLFCMTVNFCRKSRAIENEIEKRSDFNMIAYAMTNDTSIPRRFMNFKIDQPARGGRPRRLVKIDAVEFKDAVIDFKKQQ
jgi:hypothetical protein